MERQTLLDSLKMNLQKLSLVEFSRLFITETKAVEEFYKLCHNIKSGNTISLLFNPHRLSTDTEKDDIGVYESLKRDDKLSGLARLYLYNLEHGVTNPFYCAIQRGYQNIQYVNEFPPFVARSIYSEYGYVNKCGCKKIKILDPCAGWGGRMIGAASLNNVSYTGFDPSTKTYAGLTKLGDWLSVLSPSFDYTVQCLPFEDSVLDEKFDIALTSPPYYNTEHYSDEDTNSLNRYSTFDSWADGFYKPLILKTVDSLSDSGVFVLNIGDRKYPLSETMFAICKENGLYCERIKDYLSGNGDGKEKFYCISRQKRILKNQKLF